MDNKKRVFLNFNLGLCLFLVLELIFYWFHNPFARSENFLMVISVVPTVVVIFSALKSIKNKKISVDLLASIALVVSLLKREWIGIIFINLMIALARAFTNYVDIKSHSAVESLMKLKPSKVKIKRGSEIMEISIDDVRVGEKVIVELGGMVPVDGTIISGEAMVDQSSLTGESVPVIKRKGDKILSFVTVVSGSLLIDAEKIGKETTFEKIVGLVKESQGYKAPIHTMIDKFANWYIVSTLVGALLVYLFVKDLSLVSGLLLVSCADDIAVATPLALMSAILHGAKHGAIIRGGDYLEGLARVKTIIFDKTGTLTFGKLKVKGIVSFDGWDDDKVLSLAATASSSSNHPVSRAITDFAQEKKIPVIDMIDSKEYGGRGLSINLNGGTILLGNLSFMQEMKVQISNQQITKAQEVMSQGLNAVFVSSNGVMAGFISFADEVKPGIKKVMAELKSLGIEKIVMLTGDNEIVARKVAAAAGIDEFHANLLPPDKLDYLKRNLNKKYKIAMIGDGINDAPALALSDVGIVMGAIGSDVAIESADVAMMKDDISQVPELIRIGRSVLRIIRINIVVWGLSNAVGLALVFLHVLDPPGAAAYNFIADFVPIFNSLRLFRW